jgi:hypothetical protein
MKFGLKLNLAFLARQLLIAIAFVLMFIAILNHQWIIGTYAFIVTVLCVRFRTLGSLFTSLTITGLFWNLIAYLSGWVAGTNLLAMVCLNLGLVVLSLFYRKKLSASDEVLLDIHADNSSHTSGESITPNKLERTKKYRASLVADDLKQYNVSQDKVFEILLRRGIFGSLVTRENLCQYSQNLKQEITDVHAALKMAKEERANISQEIDGIKEGKFVVEDRDEHLKDMQRQYTAMSYQVEFMRGRLDALISLGIDIESLTHNDGHESFVAPYKDMRARNWFNKNYAHLR